MIGGDGFVATDARDNALLKAILPGGILHNHLGSPSLEVLCCPKQASLVSSGIAPFLSVSVPTDGETCALTIDGRGIHLKAEQCERVAHILRTHFLNCHTLRFDDFAASSFVTGRGGRGNFATDLKSILCDDGITSAVLGEVNVVLSGPQDDEQQRESVGTALVEHRLPFLNTFLIAEPLMNERERCSLLDALMRVAVPLVWGSNGEGTMTEAGSGEWVFVAGRRYTREAITKYKSAIKSESDGSLAEFQRCMNAPACYPVVKTITNFLDVAERSNVLLADNSHLSRTVSMCLNYCRRMPTFADEEKIHLIAEGIERHIMTKLYKRAFGVIPEECEIDKKLGEKLCRLCGTVTAEQLEAIGSIESHHLWVQTMFELDGMNFFKSPKNKLFCCVRAYRQLTQLVQDTMKSINEANSVKMGKKVVLEFGANELLPCFLLLVVRACPRYLYLNLQYVKRFRNEAYATAEESYCLALLESAVEFWRNYSEHQPAKSNKAEQLRSTSLDEFFVASPGECTVSAMAPDFLSPFSDDNGTFGEGSCFSFRRDDINVSKILLEEGKCFEELTVTELRAIVEEARSMLAEKQRSSLGSDTDK
ncbi:Vacuolar sorting protein 9 (VPS9) domain [Trypanosoma vivax]|nr:putative MCAK-like kinesin [Trypanosoma vivax]KAH8620718.1 Vacuolar sorting protein 9 (VPS9) domain [Trypanosoma vivax]